MKTRYTVALSVLAGAALGAAAVQGLHAQAKPKACAVSEAEILDAAAAAAFTSAIEVAQRLPAGTVSTLVVRFNQFERIW
jgi:predicted regulator of Ras-like GTPase activity (Roadblock/LC7/MglB family)